MFLFSYSFRVFIFILDMDNSINILEGTAFPTLLDFNLITTEETVVFFILTIKKDKIVTSIINVEWIKALTSKLRDVKIIFSYIFFDDNGKVLTTFIKNKYEKPLRVRTSFFFY